VNTENLSCQSLADDDDDASVNDGSSNTLNESSINTTPQSSKRVFNSLENQISNDKSQTNFPQPIDKRLTNTNVTGFKTTSTPVAKTTNKSDIQVDSDEQTG